MLVLHHPTPPNSSDYHQSPQSQPCPKPLRKLHLNSGTTQARQTGKRGVGTAVIFEHPPALLAVQSIHASLNKCQDSGRWTYLIYVTPFSLECAAGTCVL